MRLAKYLAHAGVASRRAAEQLVFGGRVRVDGEEVRDPARDVGDGNAVTVDGADVRPAGAGDLVVYALHKPKGVVSTARDPQRRRTVVSLVRSPHRLYPVGRLDADTTGLILLTNDGDLAHALTHPSFEVPKTYRARIARPPLRRPALQRLREGIRLEDGTTAPAAVRVLAPDTIEITIHEGRKRQVRRMLDAVGHPVQELQRIRFGPLALGRLAEGEARRLGAQEVAALRRGGRTGRGPGRRGGGARRDAAPGDAGPAPAAGGAGAGGGRPRAASRGDGRPQPETARGDATRAGRARPDAAGGASRRAATMPRR